MEDKVLVIYTGGTVGMKKTNRGWATSPGYLQELMGQNPAFSRPSMPKYDVYELGELLDSSDMIPKDWVVIAEVIQKHYDEFCGFVVIHGTDTMAYTASALSFMMEGLNKPIIFTGSQIPLCRARNDAQEHIITSIILASQFMIPEVCIYFDGNLLRGCRSVKVHCDSFHAFSSPNYPPLGTVGINVHLNRKLIRRSGSGGELSVHATMNELIGVLWIFPGITGDVVRNFLQDPIKGAVVMAFGVGNGPTRQPGFLEALAEASERGVVLVDCTQCYQGAVSLGSYATGQALEDVGLVSGYDMTVEAALTKMFYLFGKGYTHKKVRSLMSRDLRGELTTEKETQSYSR